MLGIEIVTDGLRRAKALRLRARMPAPPLRGRFFELDHEHPARRMPGLRCWPAQTCRGSAEVQKIRVAHLEEPGAHAFELEWLEAYGAHARACNVNRAHYGEDIGET